jgi:hypothetical protein
MKNSIGISTTKFCLLNFSVVYDTAEMISAMSMTPLYGFSGVNDTPEIHMTLLKFI